MVETETGWAGLIKDSVTCITPTGGEWVEVIFTLEEKVGSKDLANRSASKWLNLSDHFWSNSAIFLSVLDLLLAGLALEVDGFSFLDFFSGGATVVSDLTVP